MSPCLRDLVYVDLSLGEGGEETLARWRVDGGNVDNRFSNGEWMLQVTGLAAPQIHGTSALVMSHHEPVTAVRQQCEASQGRRVWAATVHIKLSL